MNYEKIGNFIKELRYEKNLTQEQLADMIPIGRPAVSKWERGKTLPDPTVLIKLSEIFNVTINEILSGQKKCNNLDNDKVTLELYKKSFLNKKIIKLLILIIVFFLNFFLIYYFFSSFKSTKVYTISGFGDYIEINNGLLVYTKEKHYFYIGEIINNYDSEISNVELFIKYKNENMNLINSEQNNFIFLSELSGYNEYNLINFCNSDYKTYIKITFKDEFYEIIELNYFRDYVNDYIFAKKVKNSTDNKSTNDNSNNVETDIIEQLIISKFEENDKINIKKENKMLTLNYDKNNQVISIICEIDETFIENWNYNINTKTLGYSSDKVSYLYNSNELICLIGNCNKIYEEKNKEFIELVKNSI